jgi:hypothetical protein
LPSAARARENARKECCEARTVRLGRRQRAGGYLTELGEATLTGADDEDLVTHLHEVDRAPCIERQKATQRDRSARPTDAEASRTPEYGHSKAAHHEERDESLDEIAPI